MADPALDASLARLDAGRRRVLARLEGIPHDVLNRAPAPGQWSPLQVLEHVVTSEELTLRYLRKKVQAGPSLEKAGPAASRLRLLAVQVTLALPVRVQAPAQVAEVPSESELAAVGARWQGVRQELEEFVRSYPAELLDRLVFRHPFAGRMRLVHALGTLESHLEHHSRQIDRSLIGRPA